MVTGNEIANATPNGARRLLLAAGHSLLTEQGYEIEDRSHGQRTEWVLRRNGVNQRADVRTTRDRWFASTRSDDGHWRALEASKLVVVMATDDRTDPREIQVYALPAEKVLQRLEEHCAARDQAGVRVSDGFSV